VDFSEPLSSNNNLKEASSEAQVPVKPSPSLVFSARSQDSSRHQASGEPLNLEAEVSLAALVQANNNLARSVAHQLESKHLVSVKLQEPAAVVYSVHRAPVPVRLDKRLVEEVPSSVELKPSSSNLNKLQRLVAASVAAQPLRNLVNKLRRQVEPSVAQALDSAEEFSEDKSLLALDFLVKHHRV